MSSSSRASKLIGTGSNFPSGAASGLSTARSPATLMLPLSTIYPSDAALKNDAVAGKPSTSFPSLLGDIELCLGERSSSLDGSGLADAYHDFSSKNAGVSCKSLVSQFCKRAAGRALDVAQLTKQLRAPLRLRYRPKPSSSVAEDPDQPPRLSRLPTSRAARDLLTIKHPVLGRRMRLDIARLAALQEREQCVITLEHYCFRLLRALNFCFSSWGSHERSYVWHSNRICNALNYRDVSSYCLIFEDIIHEVHLCLNEVYGFAAAQQRRPHDSRPGRPRGATGKRGSGTASGFERMTSGEIPQVESAQSLGREENKNKNYSTAATKNAAVGQENTFAVAKHFKNTKSKRPATLTEIPSHVASGLLASLMFQLDVGMFGQCLTLLDTLRKQRDPNFQPFALTQEAIASFLTMQSFHAVHQPPLHFLNGAATRFRSAAELSSTAAGRGGRRRAAAAAAWTTFLELGGTVSSVGAPDILGLGKLRTKKQHSTETKTSLTALNRGVVRQGVIYRDGVLSLDCYFCCGSAWWFLMTFSLLYASLFSEHPS